MSKLLYKLHRACMRFYNVNLGMRLSLTSPDRKWLHSWVRCYCLGKSVLSVGVSWYTMLLPELAPGSTWTTIDINEEAAVFGATSNVHLTADITKQQLSGYKYNAIIVNGVFGRWGIDTADLAKSAIDNLRKSLSTDGMLLIGFNDSEEGISYDIGTVIATDWPELTLTRVAVADRETRHTYLVYVNNAVTICNKVTIAD